MIHQTQKKNTYSKFYFFITKNFYHIRLNSEIKKYREEGDKGGNTYILFNIYNFYV